MIIGWPRVMVVEVEGGDHRQLHSIETAFELSLKIVVLNSFWVKVPVKLMEIIACLFIKKVPPYTQRHTQLVCIISWPY